jgi:hypothetical protein
MRYFSLFTLLFIQVLWINPLLGQDFDTDFKKAQECFTKGKYSEAGALFKKMDTRQKRGVRT